MFIRKLKNRSGSVSIQIISKSSGKYIVLKTIGSASSGQEIAPLIHRAKQEISILEKQTGMFIFENDALIQSYLKTLQNAQIRTVGPELIFGKIYDFIGFNVIQEDLFRHLVISRLAFPLSKLKTIEYLYRFQGVALNISTVYRFLDKLSIPMKLNHPFRPSYTTFPRHIEPLIPRMLNHPFSLQFLPLFFCDSRSKN